VSSPAERLVHAYILSIACDFHVRTNQACSKHIVTEFRDEGVQDFIFKMGLSIRLDNI
jgi:hypothetical protein